MGKDGGERETMIEVTDKKEILEQLWDAQLFRPKINALLITVWRKESVPRPDPYPFEFKTYDEARAFIRDLDVGDVYKIRVVLEPFRPVQHIEPNYEVCVKESE
jgi:hypothetical protein